MFPYRMAHFNRRLTNPVLRPAARWVPPLAVVEHVGRRSGRAYRTPVFAFCRDGEVTIVLSYGERTEWVRNVVTAGGGVLARRGRRFALTDPDVRPVAERGPMSALGRFSSRFADDVLVAKLSREPVSG